MTKPNTRFRVGAISLWLIWSIFFILRSPNGAFTHDTRGHLQHTRILYNEHRLAFPREGNETYGPPLYYLVNCLLTPNRPIHIFYVRLMSTLYGALCLWLMMEMLSRCRVTPNISAVVLSFIATTPSFLFLFTAYNNDSLATLLSMSMLVAADDWIRHEQRRSLILLGFLAVAGLYTKLSILFTLGALTTLLACLGMLRQVTWQRIIPIGIVLAISGLLLTPWLLGHNYRLTGQLTPAPADQPFNDQIRLPHSALRTLLTPPGWSRGEWKDPYADTWGAVNHKKNSFWAYVFDTSVFGEFTFEFLPPAIPWAILVLHACLWIAAIFGAGKSPYGKVCLGLVFLGALFMTTLIFRSSNYANLMDFRYIAWTWLPGSILCATCLVSSPSPSFSSASLFRTMMVSGTILHTLLWMGLMMGGHWNIPS